MYVGVLNLKPLKATGKEEGLFVIKNTYPVRGFVLEGKSIFKIILLAVVLTILK